MNGKLKQPILFLNRLRELVPAFCLIVLCRLNRPHSEALQEIGIRIVSLGDDEQLQAYKSEVWHALRVLRRYDKRRMDRVRRTIRTVYVGPIVKTGFYMHMGRVCILNLTSMPAEWDQLSRLFAIAGMIVHEATHGALDDKNIPFCGMLNKRIEKMCNREQSRAMETLLQRCNNNSTQLY